MFRFVEELPASYGSAYVKLAQLLYYIHDYKPYIETVFDYRGSSCVFSSDRCHDL